MSIVKLGFFAIKILTIGLLTKQPSSVQVAHLIPCKCQQISNSSKIRQCHRCQVSTTRCFCMDQILQLTPQLLMAISCQSAKQTTTFCENTDTCNHRDYSKCIALQRAAGPQVLLGSDCSLVALHLYTNRPLIPTAQPPGLQKLTLRIPSALFCQLTGFNTDTSISLPPRQPAPAVSNACFHQPSENENNEQQHSFLKPLIAKLVTLDHINTVDFQIFSGENSPYSAKANQIQYIYFFCVYIYIYTHTYI